MLVPERADQRGVQGLVAIELGNGNMVFELARHGLVHLMQHAHAGVAISHGGHDDAKAVDIGDLRKTQVLVVHLAVDGIERFLAPHDAHAHALLARRRFPLRVALL